MAATLTAVADNANKPPRVILTVAGATGTTVTIQRVDQQGNRSEVRTANPATLAAGGWVGFDYEAPYNQPVTYVGRLDDTSAATLGGAPAQLTVAQSWLIHPGLPDLSVPLTVTEAPTMSRASSRGLYSVLGRAEMVARSDGQRKARVFDLSVRTLTAADEDALDTLIDDDSVLLLQVATAGIYRSSYYWVSVGDVTQAPLIGHMDGRWVWTLPCTEAARPAGLLQSQRTWADVVAENATWADVVSKYATWRDLILDQQSVTVLSTGGGGTVSGETYVDNGDGTLTVTGATDNGDGTITITSGTDNGDGTITVATTGGGALTTALATSTSLTTSTTRATAAG